jgi:phosphoenolpyruvate-protein phosphotransferase (PTS system enzyme I)
VARARDTSSDRFRRGGEGGTTDRISRDGRTKRKNIFKGTTVVPGISMGTVRLKFRQTHVFSDQTITFQEVEREHERLNEAVRQAKAQLLEARTKVQQNIGELEAMIFDAHLAILEDQGFLKKIRSQVQTMLKPVEVVVSEIVEGYYRLLSMKEAEELRERAADIRDIGRRLLDNLAKLKNPGQEYPEGEDHRAHEDEIIFAREILPSDLVTIEHRHCKGVICETGSGRGHAGVMLRAMNVPTVMGLEGLAENLFDGDFVIIDGTNGVVYVNPKKDVVDSFTVTLKEFENYKTVLRGEVDLPAVTTDGFPIQLLANVSKQSDIDLAKLYNVDGVGLFRSEFHLMVGSSFPDEEEQYWIYREAVEKMNGKPVTIRTMDLGSDKKLPYLKLPDDETHGLGRRSIRLVPELEEFQLIQLRAILRASAHGNTRLMWPFVTSLEDIRLAKRLVRLAKRDLDKAKQVYDVNIPIGMMVEVPAAALSLDKYVRDVQFFSVGTNDLTQYVCAADRNNADVAPWYKGHNPGMLALMKIIVDSAKAHNADLTICGEMAGDPFYTMFLLGLGVTKLSMPAPQVPLVKKIIRSINISGATNLASRALEYTSTSQIRELFATTVQQILGRDLGGWTRTTGE